MITGRGGGLKTQPPAEQASSERTGFGTPKQIHNEEGENMVTRMDHIFLYYCTMLKGNRNCINLFSDHFV